MSSTDVVTGDLIRLSGITPVNLYGYYEYQQHVQ